MRSERKGSNVRQILGKLPAALVAGLLVATRAPAAPAPSIARVWDEEILSAIRIDLPHPPVHARNLFHFSVAMYDAWASYDPVAVGYVYRAKHTASDLEAARLMIYRAADALDRADPQASMYSAMGKRYATDLGFEICNQALQLHGGYGYLKDYGLEKLVRDLRVHQILEGTNEIMRVVVSRKVLGGNRG